jgi:type IV pilus assembly protein PilN
MIKINLLPYRQEREKLGTYGLLLAAGGILLLSISLLAVMWFRQNSQIASLQGEKTVLQQELDDLKPIIEEADKIKKEVKILKSKVQAIDILKKDQQGPVRLLDELSDRIAEDAWLDSLNEQNYHFTAKGSALTNKGIATFMKNLARSDHFQEVELLQSIQTTSMEEEIYDFTITFRWVSTLATEEK